MVKSIEKGKLLLAWNGDDTAVANAEVNSPYSSFSPWNTTANRQWSCSYGLRLHTMTVFLETNGNASDGALFRSRINGATGTQSVTVDQATGFFQQTGVDEDAPRASATNQNNIQFQYIEGGGLGGTVGCQLVSYEAEIID